MEASTDFCLLMTSVDSEAAAQALAGGMVEAGLAACVQLFPMTSFYVWKGESRREAEYLLLVKTRTDLATAAGDFIRAHHPYELPELLQLPVTGGSAAYLQWLRAGTAGGVVAPPAGTQE
ncbi:divalent-cation tolerance protein CutA [Polaromonas sp.]|uniref:divalent-cation tolerance protein CutA n=1 Tax=Polaromonas sp. TaxID=1869339 RepID=UPI003265F2A1